MNANIEELVEVADLDIFDGRGVKATVRKLLTEQAAHYENLASVTKTNSDRLLRKANERIQQLEGGLVPDRETLVDIIADGLHGTYHCTRVWSAWGIGTMSEHDFEPVDESDTPAELADAVLSLLAEVTQLID